MISFSDVLSSVWRFKYSAIATFILIISAVVGYCLIVTPTYEASTLLIVDQGSSENSPQQATRQDEIINSQARIAKSEAVIRNAILVYGFEKLYPQLGKTENAGAGFSSQVSDLIAELGLSDWVQLRSDEPVGPDAALLLARTALDAQAEPKTNLIRISFRHSNPTVAAGFLNAIAHSFIERSIELHRPSGTAEFFEEQKRKYETQFENASAKLSAFSASSSMYSIEEQQKLALNRASSLSAALASTRSAVAAKEAELKSTADQLLRMKPTLNSPVVASMIADIATAEQDKQGTGRKKKSNDDSMGSVSSDPPLLLVRVYQDSVQALVQKNADIAGLRAQQAQQESELSNVNVELSELALREAEYERLKREVARAAFNAENFAKRAAVEQLDLDLSEAKFSTVKIAQAAETPLRPHFPQLSLLLPFGVIVGLIAGTAVTLMRLMASARSNEKGNLVSKQYNLYGLRPDINSAEASPRVREGFERPLPDHKASERFIGNARHKKPFSQSA